MALKIFKFQVFRLTPFVLVYKINTEKDQILISWKKTAVRSSLVKNNSRTAA